MPEYAKTRGVEQRHIVCPGCGKDDALRYEHLMEDRTAAAACGSRFGPWTCGGCGLEVSGRVWSDGTVELTRVEQGKTPIKGLMLLKLNVETGPPVFFVVEHELHRHPQEDADWEDNLRYWVGCHTCPTNIIRVEEIIHDGDTDPHGILEYVQFVPMPEEWDGGGNRGYSAYCAIFDRLPRPEIEGEATEVRLLGGRQQEPPAQPDRAVGDPGGA